MVTNVNYICTYLQEEIIKDIPGNVQEQQTIPLNMTSRFKMYEYLLQLR